MSIYHNPAVFQPHQSGDVAGRTAPPPSKQQAHRGQHPNPPSNKADNLRRQLQFQVTHDLDDGQCCPPYFDNGVPWRVVMRAGNHTIWSRPLSGSASVAAWRAALEDYSPAPTATRNK